MDRYVYTGKDKQRFSVSGFSGTFIPNEEIVIPEDKIDTLRKVFPRLLRKVSAKQKKND